MGHESQRSKYMLKVCNSRASLVGPWLRIHLPKKKKRESTCQCRGRGFHPWFRKSPHATSQLSPCATTPEPMLWSRHHNEKPEYHEEEWLLLAATRESLPTALKTEHSQK